MISGLVIVLLMSGFFFITIWAWSEHKRADFAEAEQLPLFEDATTEAQS